MKCNNCGMLNENESNFCSNCGAKIENNKSSKTKIIVIIILIVLLLIIGIVAILLLTRKNGNGNILSGNDPKDEPLPYWVTDKAPDPLRDSDRVIVENKLAEYSKENNNAKFKIARYFYDDCYSNEDTCILSYVYVIPVEYPQVMFHYCVNETKYGCQLEKNKTAYTDAVLDYKARIALYDLAEEMGLDSQLLYGHFNFSEGELGASIVINNKISISDSEKLISNLVKKMNSDDYYISVYYVGQGSNKEYKEVSNGLGIVDLGDFCRRFGPYEIYTIKDENGSIKLTNPRTIDSPYNY